MHQQSVHDSDSGVAEIEWLELENGVRFTSKIQVAICNGCGSHAGSDEESCRDQSQDEQHHEADDIQWHVPLHQQQLPLLTGPENLHAAQRVWLPHQSCVLKLSNLTHIPGSTEQALPPTQTLCL